jgi:LacI family transcriptional regulator
MEVPRRLSLVAQATDILRRDLQRGEWTDFLPGEKSLCERLQVSRPTVRAALAALRSDGIIEIAKGRRARIVRKPRGVDGPSSRVVVFLTGLAWEALESYTLFRISELRDHLQDAGYKLEVRADTRVHQKRPFKVLANLLDEVRACCWLLHTTNSDVQRWFHVRSVHAIVMGSPQPGIRFPSIDIDYRAVSRHAAGTLLGFGHRRINLLVRGSREGRDLATEQGFLEAFEKAGHPDAAACILRHDGSVRNIRSLIGTALRSNEQPTALLVMNPGVVLTVVSQLLNSGVRLPQDMSLIALDDERYLRHLVPSVTRYRIDWNTYAAKLSRLVIELATSGTLMPRRILVMPRFEKGETVAAMSAIRG